jgi:hypothetical protein
MKIFSSQTAEVSMSEVQLAVLPQAVQKGVMAVVKYAARLFLNPVVTKRRAM